MLGVRHSEILILLSTADSNVTRHLKCMGLHLGNNLRCSVFCHQSAGGKPKAARIRASVSE